MSLRPDSCQMEVQPGPATHRYRVYGLEVASELALPELVPSPSGQADVSIELGPVAPGLEETLVGASWYAANRHEFLLRIDNVARYYVADGRRITIDVDSAGQAPASDLRLWLLGSAFGALLHQRGLLPLHVSAVKAPGGAWAFTGESGEGKSTMAAFLHRRFGWPLVSDDVSVVTASDGQSMVHPGPRKLKLWQDALETLDFAGCEAVRDLSNTDKFQLYLPGEQDYMPEVLRGLVVLSTAGPDSPPRLERLKGIEAFDACMAAIYRPYMDHWFKQPAERMNGVLNLCRQVPVYRFVRARSLTDLEQNLQPLLELINNAEP